MDMAGFDTGVAASPRGLLTTKPRFASIPTGLTTEYERIQRVGMAHFVPRGLDPDVLPAACLKDNVRKSSFPSGKMQGITG